MASSPKASFNSSVNIGHHSGFSASFIEIMDWHVNKTVGKITPGMSIRIEEIE